MSYAQALLNLTGVRGWKVMDDDCDAQEFLNRLENWPDTETLPTAADLEIEYQNVLQQRQQAQADAQKKRELDRLASEYAIAAMLGDTAKAESIRDQAGRL